MTVVCGTLCRDGNRPEDQWAYMCPLIVDIGEIIEDKLFVLPQPNQFEGMDLTDMTYADTTQKRPNIITTNINRQRVCVYCIFVVSQSSY